jgi:hypothetical protein
MSWGLFFGFLLMIIGIFLIVGAVVQSFRIQELVDDSEQQYFIKDEDGNFIPYRKNL